jgi:hypothetical protein
MCITDHKICTPHTYQIHAQQPHLSSLGKPLPHSLPHTPCPLYVAAAGAGAVHPAGS